MNKLFALATIAAALLWSLFVWGAGLLGLLVCAALTAMLGGALRSALGRWGTKPAAAPQA